MTDFARIILRVRTSIDERDIEFTVDTGFDGELAVPSSFVSWLGPPSDYCTAFFANGQEERRGLVPCEVQLFDEPRSAVSMYIDGQNPLIGLELLEGLRLTIEATEQGEVLLEML